MSVIKTILRQTAEAESFRYIVERRHLNDAADYIGKLETACEAMLACTGGSENWNGETHEALKLMEAALAAVRT